VPKDFAIIPDVDLAGANPTARLIYQDDDIAPLRGFTDWNPAAGYPTIERADFIITPLPPPQPLSNEIDGSLTDMHVCSVRAR
jgi:hypothetical protein